MKRLHFWIRLIFLLFRRFEWIWLCFGHLLNWCYLLHFLLRCLLFRNFIRATIRTFLFLGWFLYRLRSLHFFMERFLFRWGFLWNLFLFFSFCCLWCNFGLLRLFFFFLRILYWMELFFFLSLNSKLDFVCLFWSLLQRLFGGYFVLFFELF